MDQWPPLNGFAVDSDYAGLLEQNFRLVLPSAELVQRASESPIRYQGAAIVEQKGEGPLTLIFIAQSDGKRKIESIRAPAVGVLEQDTDLFDLTATDVSGNKWMSHALTVFGSYGRVGCELHSALGEIFNTNSTPRDRQVGYVRAWIRAPTLLPWRDRVERVFQGECDTCRWRVQGFERNTQIEFAHASGHDFYPAFEKFLAALSIVASHELEPCIIDLHVPRFHTRVYRSRQWRGEFNKRPALPMLKRYTNDINDFIERFICRIGDKLPYVVSAWRRVHQADVYSESKVSILVVTIETLLRECFADFFAAPDEAFISDLKQALSVVESSAASDRTISFFRAAIDNAGRTNPKSALANLVREELISSAHFKAWNSLRHSAVHENPWRNKAPQKIVDKEAACYGLFQRLIFALVGYNGIQRHYHLPHYPFTAWADRGESGI